MLTAEYDFEALANDRHLWFWGAPDPLALSSEVCPMDLPPILERSIAFAFCGRKLFGDFIVGNDIDSLCFDDTKGRLDPVRDDAQVADFW